MTKFEPNIRWVLIGLVLCSIRATALAQIEPLGAHYGGRTSDTGFADVSNSTGGYVTAVPLELPPTRDGTTVPLQILSGGSRVGAAGAGWDVPLSYVMVDNSIDRRKPRYDTAQTRARQRVSVTINAQSTEMVLTSNGLWKPRKDDAILSAEPKNGGWNVYDGKGHTYIFTQPTGLNIYLLTEVDDSSGAMIKLAYNTVARPGVTLNVAMPGEAYSVDLKSILYNTYPGLGCFKHEIDLTYGVDSAAPLSFSVLAGDLVERFHTLNTVAVTSRSNCSTPAVALRTFQLQYSTDADTGLPRLSSVQMLGRTGTPEATSPVPIATYHYGSATNGGSLTYSLLTTIAAPSGADATQISSTVNAGTDYGTFQTLTDVNGDGLPDLVTKNGTMLSVSSNRLNAAGMATFGTTVPLGDTAVKITGPFYGSELQTTRAPYNLDANFDIVYRQAIDVNGDGRIDVIDAGESPDQWIVYLNMPGQGPSGVEWQKRSIPIAPLVHQLELYGYTFPHDRYLALSTRVTARDSDLTGGSIVINNEHTFTEWELKDINGDGYPDFVFNTGVIQGFVAPDGGGGQLNFWGPGVGNVGDVTQMPTRSGTRTLAYFASGQVSRITAGTSNAVFRYDPFGDVEELDVDSSTDFRRDRRFGDLIEVSGTTPVISRKIPGPDGFVATLRGSNSWIFDFGEARGLRFTSDQLGSFLQDVTYQPFGEVTSTGGSGTPNSPAYTSMQWNGGDNLAAFGLAQVGARIYDPVLGRFLGRDPVVAMRSAAMSNPYAFAMNDPINRSDPSGLDPEGGPQGTDGGDSSGGGAGLPIISFREFVFAPFYAFAPPSGLDAYAKSPSFANLSSACNRGTGIDCVRARSRALDARAGTALRHLDFWASAALSVVGSASEFVLSAGTLSAALDGVEASVAMNVAADYSLFRGTHSGYAGNRTTLQLGITPTTTDPLVATAFATAAESFGEGVVHVVSGRSLGGVTLMKGNALAELEAEIGVELLPVNFAEAADTSVPVGAARAILKELGLPMPTRLRLDELQDYLHATPRLTPEQVRAFIRAARTR